jgi:hypothetical protein
MKDPAFKLRADEVNRWLEENGSSLDYLPAGGDFNQDVNAPKLLGAAFAHFSGNRVRFDKTIHSVGLADWLIEKEPQELNEIAELLGRFIP